MYPEINIVKFIIKFVDIQKSSILSVSVNKQQIKKKKLGKL